MATWRGAVRHNLGLKVGSVVVACVVWYATNAFERDAERVVEVPVLPRHVPAELVVVDPPTARVAVTLRGPRTLLEEIDADHVRFVLPVRTLQVGRNRIDLQLGRIEPELPRRLRVVRLQPGRLEMRTEAMRRRRLPVRVELAGSPAFGYSVSESHVMPDEVEVAGPANVVDRLRTLHTAPIDLRGLDADFTRSVSLEWVGDYVVFDPDRVTVTARIEDVVVSREFPHVAVRVVGSAGATLVPATVSLTLRGPERLLHNFRLPAGAVVVDASGLAPGSHQVEVTVQVPPEVEVITRQPDVHRVDVPREGAS